MHAIRGCLAVFLPCFREGHTDDDYSELRSCLELISTESRDTEYFNALHSAFKACYSFSNAPDMHSWGLASSLTDDFALLLEIKQYPSKDVCIKAQKSGIPLYIISEISDGRFELEASDAIHSRYIKMLGEDCPICLATIETTDFVAKTLLRMQCCGNFLHKTCLDQWKGITCSTCRASFDRPKNSDSWTRTIDTIHVRALTELGLRDEEFAKELAAEDQKRKEAQLKADEEYARKISLLQFTQEV